MERARRNVSVARTAIAIATVGAFALFAGLARASHPGRAQATSSGSSSSTSAVEQDNSYFNDDSGSSTNLGPSGSASPQVQSGAS